MSYATVLVHVQPDLSVQYRLRAACELAKRFDAMLIGVAVEMVRAEPFDDGFTNINAQWFETIREIASKNQETARAQFDAAASGMANGALWISGFDFPARGIARASRAADIIVTSRPPDGRHDAYMDADVAELALISGRPVLVVPPRAAPLSGKRVVVAWKDVREARRAISDAMPLLEQAEAVLVLEVCSGEEAADAKIRTEVVAAALARHGVTAEAKVTVGRLGAGAEIILAVETLGADLIVSGAYGHTRLGEWAFGGVTRELLDQERCYVLLSH